MEELGGMEQKDFMKRAQRGEASKLLSPETGEAGAGSMKATSGCDLGESPEGRLRYVD